MHNLNKIAACLFLTLCAACVAPPKPQVKVVDSVTLNPGDSRKLDILANQSWRDTGINISPGETYQLTASGAWTNSALICGYSDADGIGANRFCRQDPLNLGVLGHALVGRIGENGKVFHVGKKLTLTAKTKGRLALWDYDDPRFIGDNAGKMTVTITRLGAPQAKQSAATDNQFSNEPLTLDFKQAAIQPHDVAVIIGNANYKRQGRDIPDVLPAYADAASFRKYAERQLGIKPGNIIALSDATKNQLERVFGTNRNHRGQLFDWVKSGKSKVYVYYAGHGAPAGKNGDAYLVPTDADAARLELNGYPLSTLYKNLAKLPATEVSVVLEACFSGNSPGGSIFAKASGIYIQPKIPQPARKINVISAGGSDQMASWERDQSHGLFTKFYLTGLSGAADKAPTGNEDGRVSDQELQAYLKETMSYYARRYYGRDQVAQFKNR